MSAFFKKLLLVLFGLLGLLILGAWIAGSAPIQIVSLFIIGMVVLKRPYFMDAEIIFLPPSFDTTDRQGNLRLRINTLYCVIHCVLLCVLCT